MCAYRDAALCGFLDGIFEALHVMAPVDKCQGRIFSGLQTVFDPDLVMPGVVLEQVQYRLIHTIWAGADRQPDDIIHLQGFVIQLLQMLQRSVCVGKRLEIGNEFFGLVAL